MTEREMYGPIVVGARLEGWALYRIHDGAPGKSPFDIGGTAPGGLGVAIECKALAGSASLALPFDWRPFEAHQAGWLRAFAEAGAVSLAVLHWKGGGETFAFRLSPVDFSGLPPAPMSAMNWRRLEPARIENVRVFRGLAAFLASSKSPGP